MITSKLLANLFPNTPRQKRDRFIDALNKYLPKYRINTAKRVRAFLATCGVETDYFKTTVEYASGSAYEGRADLGNTQKGDGKRFRGRGIIQTTGRYNYERVNKRCGKKLGIDFIKNPERLAEIDIAVESACIFWEENNLNKYADADNFFAVSGVVNRGNPKKKALHYDKREALYSVCKKYIASDFLFVPEDTAAFGDTAVTPETAIGSTEDNSITTATAQSDLATSMSVSSTTPAETSLSDRISAGDGKTEIDETEKSAIRAKADKFILHCRTDSAKNIALTVAGRITASITTLYASGVHGKLFLIIISALIVGFTLYAFLKYRARLNAWVKALFESILS